MTAVGELVYQRQVLDFKAMNRIQKRDFVLEENLLDVKKLLKTSNFVDKTHQKSKIEMLVACHHLSKDLQIL
jgi:hypothetical protein